MLVGIDSLDISRISKLIKTKAQALKVFTPYEWEYGNRTVNNLARFAGMFCAKEAFLKSLKIGVGGGIALADIEVNHDKNGAPYINLINSAKEFVKNMNISSIEISITHTETTSTAICICF